MSLNRKILTSVIFITVMLVTLIYGNASEGKTGSDVLDTSEKSVAVAKEDQKAVENWMTEEKALFEEIEAMSMRLK